MLHTYIHRQVQVQNLLSEIPKTEHFFQDVVCTPKLAFDAKLDQNDPRSTQVTQLCVSVPVRCTSPLLLTDILCIFC